MIGVIAQGLAQLLDGEVQGVLEIHEGIFTPQLLLQFLTRDQFAGTLEQKGEDLEGLRLQADAAARFAQLACAQVEFEGANTEH